MCLFTFESIPQEINCQLYDRDQKLFLKVFFRHKYCAMAIYFYKHFILNIVRI